MKQQVRDVDEDGEEVEEVEEVETPMDEEWIGRDIKQEFSGKKNTPFVKKYYSGVKVGNLRFFLGDFVKVAPEYIARIDELYENVYEEEKDGQSKHRDKLWAGRWFYRLDEVSPNAFSQTGDDLEAPARDREIFWSQHISDNKVSSIEKVILIHFIVDGKRFVFTRNYDGEDNGRVTPLGMETFLCTREYSHESGRMKRFIDEDMLQSFRYDHQILRLSERHTFHSLADPVINRKQRILLNNFTMLFQSFLNTYENISTYSDDNLGRDTEKAWYFDGTTVTLNTEPIFPFKVHIYRMKGAPKDFHIVNEDIVLIKKTNYWLEYAKVVMSHDEVIKVMNDLDDATTTESVSRDDIVAVLPSGSPDGDAIPGKLVAVELLWEKNEQCHVIPVRVLLTLSKLRSILIWPKILRQKLFMSIKHGGNYLSMPNKLNKPPADVQLFCGIMMLFRPFSSSKHCSICFDDQKYRHPCSNTELCKVALCSSCIQHHSFFEPEVVIKSWPWLCPACTIEATDQASEFSTPPEEATNPYKDLEDNDKAHNTSCGIQLKLIELKERNPGKKPRKWQPSHPTDPSEEEIETWEKNCEKIEFSTVEKFLFAVKEIESSDFFDLFLVHLIELNALFNPILQNRRLRCLYFTERQKILRQEAKTKQDLQKLNKKQQQKNAKILANEPQKYSKEQLKLVADKIDEICCYIRMNGSRKTLNNFKKYLPPSMHWLLSKNTK